MNILLKPYTNIEYAEFAHNANQVGKRIEITEVAAYMLAENEALENDEIVDISSTEEYQAKKLAELKCFYIDIVQSMLDEKVKEKGYDSIFTAISYINSIDTNFKAEAEVCSKWRDEVWRNCYAILDEVLSGQREQPTVEELLIELPQLVWPDEV